MKPTDGGIETPNTYWSWRDIILATILVLTIGTIATAVTVGGGGLLLLFSPVLIFFSPILVPLAIVFTVVAGGAATLAGGTALFAGAVAWIYSYITGGRPYGAESADAINSKARQLAGQAKEQADQAAYRARETISQTRDKASETANSAYGYLQSKTPQAA